MATDARTEATPERVYYWPNKMGRMYLLALEDVLGRNGLNAILSQAGLRHRMNNYPPDNLDLGWSFEETSALNQGLSNVHGRQGGKGLAIRAGRAWFHYALKDFGAVLGIADLAFRLLPSGMKLKLGLNAIADTFSNTSDQIVRLEEAEGQLLYHIERCPTCWGRTAEVPICHTDLGLLQEGLHWVTGSKDIRAEEILCVARGDPSCTFRVDTQALG
ncbi:V4R domain-containing protein [Chloroflexota bacterium]